MQIEAKCYAIAGVYYCLARINGKAVMGRGKSFSEAINNSLNKYE